MKKDFELLKSSPKVIVNGISTTVDGDFIARPFWNYMDDIWEYIEKRFPGETFEEGEAWDIDPRFERFEYDELGYQYVVLNTGNMKEDEIDWDYDYVFVDTSNFPSYEQWNIDKMKCLSDIDLPHDIHDLSDEQLKELRGKICAGSCYLADYNNSMFIDRDVLSGYAESYLEWIEVENLKDTGEEFAYYIREVA